MSRPPALRLLLAAAAAAPAAAATVRIGGLYPQRRTSGVPYTMSSRRMAAFVMAIEEINNRSDLLPHTNLSFAVKDSKCSQGYALVGAHELISEAFGGAGVSALVGAACSSASASAASYANLYSVPQISPSSTSATLSDSVMYPYFARVAPSDALQSFALADLVEYQLGVSRVACVHSDDDYGTTGMAAFINEARLRRIDRLAVTSFANGATDFAPQIDVLRSSGAAVVVLFCQSIEAADFIAAVQAAGGLENLTWVGSEAATAAISTNLEHLQPAVMGFLGLRPPIGEGKIYTEFLSRLDAFHAGVVGEWGCSDATDDDGNRLWRLEDAEGGGCIWSGPAAASDFYASFSYDAVFAVAHALHGLVDGTDGSADGVDGDALHAAILATNFTGATGAVGLDAHGDRNRGVRYDVFSVSDGAGFFQLGTWVEGNTWADRFTQAANASYVSVYGTAMVRSDLASSSGVLKLGVMCHTAELRAGGSTTFLEECDQVLHAVDVINDKADGVFDALLANHTIVTAVREVGCVEGRAEAGWLALQQSSPGGFDFGAVIGPSCSDDVAQLGNASWRAAAGRAVVISHASTAEKIGSASGEAAYANVARTVTPDGERFVGISKLCHDYFGWGRLAILHDDSVWAAGGAEGFKRRFEADGGTVLRGLDGNSTVGFELAAFDSGALHVSSLVERLRAVEPSVIVVITQPRVQRAFFAFLHEQRVLSGPGYGYITLWMSQDVFLNNASSVNTSAVYGAEGVLALTPSALVGLPSVVEPIVERWDVAARAACDGLAYCDADGDPTSWSEYSASAVDAVLLYAHAADAVLRAGGDAHDPDLLYQTMLAMPSFEGVAGRVVLDEYGDRLGGFQLYNLQIGSGLGGGGGRPPERRRLSTSIGLDMSAAYVEVGSYDALTQNLTVDVASIVFSKGTTQRPITDTPCERNPLVAADYAAYNVSSCDWYHKPRFSFYFPAMTTPRGECKLPLDTDALDWCTFSFPRRLPAVQAFIWIPASLPLLLLLYLVAALALHTARLAVDRPNRSSDEDGDGGGGGGERRRLRPALDLAEQTVPSLRMACMYVLVWLGAAAHALATPLVFSDGEPGYADDGACVAREAMGALAPALVVVGVTARVGQVLCDRFTTRSEADARYREPYNKFFFLVLCTVLAGLGWALDRERRRTDGPAAEPFNLTVDVVLQIDGAQSSTTNIDLEFVRCRRLSDYGDNTYFALVLPVHIICVLGVALHALRMWRLVRGEHQHIILTEGLMLTLLTLCLNLFMLVFLTTGTSDGNRGDFRVRSSCGAIVGWMTLFIEGGLPEFRRYVERKKDGELLLLDRQRGDKKLELEAPLRTDQKGGGSNRQKSSSGSFDVVAPAPTKGSHIFLSHNWSRGQDQVHSIVPMLRSMVPEPRCIQLWLDDEQLKVGVSKERLEAAVRASDTILVFLTEKYVSSEFCRAELTAAYQSEVQIIVVQEVSKDRGGVTSDELKTEIEEAKRKAESMGEALSEDTVKALEHLYDEVKAQWDGIRTPLFWYRTQLFKRAVLRHVVQQLVERRQKVKNQRAGADKKHQQSDDRVHAWNALAPKESVWSLALRGATQRSDNATQRDDELAKSSRYSERSDNSASTRDQLVFPDELKPLPSPANVNIFLYLSPKYPKALRDALETAFSKAAQTLKDRHGGRKGKVVVRINAAGQKLKEFKNAHENQEITPVLCLHDEVGCLDDGVSEEGDGMGKPFFASDDLLDVTKTVFKDLIEENKHQKGRGGGDNEDPDASKAVGWQQNIGEAAKEVVKGFVPPLRASYRSASQRASTRDSARDEEVVSGRARDAVGVAAVLFQNTKGSMSSYIEQAQSLDKKDDEDLRDLRECLFKPVWKMWPQDRMLQQVAAEAELIKLLEAKAKKPSGSLHEARRRLSKKMWNSDASQVVPDPIDGAADGESDTR